MAKRLKSRTQSARQSGEVSVDPRQLALFLREAIQLDAAVPTRPGEPVTLEQFWPRFMREHVMANRQSPATVLEKQGIFRIHLRPRFGARELSSISASDIQQLKADLSSLSAKRANNILTVLNKCLGCAQDWGVIRERPHVKFLKSAAGDADFLEFEAYSLLCGAATRVGVFAHAMVRLGGDGGLRMGEMMGLQADDADHQRMVLHVRRAISAGVVSLPKGGKPRVVPMTDALAAALKALPAKDSGRLLTREDGADVSPQVLRTWMEHSEREAGSRERGALHILRHTFCSHLAMRGAPLLSIKELAGHQSLRTTMRYMHLAPSEKTRAISLLNGAPQESQHDGMPGQASDADMSPRGFEPPGQDKSEKPHTERKRKRNNRADASRRAASERLAKVIAQAIHAAMNDGDE